MPNPIELLTKPLQIAFGALRNVQHIVEGLLGGDEPPPQTSHEPQATKAKPRPKQLDDVTITRKVETVLFRDGSVDKGKISVNTADGVVTLRGEAKTPQQIKALEAKAGQIPEVKDVENLLHLPKTPARTKARRPKTSPKRTARRTTAERKPATATAEPSPKDLAQKRAGRQPAPLGSSDS